MQKRTQMSIYKTEFGHSLLGLFTTGNNKIKMKSRFGAVPSCHYCKQRTTRFCVCICVLKERQN